MIAMDEYSNIPRHILMRIKILFWKPYPLSNIDEKKIGKSLEIGRKKEGKKGKVERIIEYSATCYNANRNSSLKTFSTCTNIDEKQSINP